MFVNVNSKRENVSQTWCYRSVIPASWETEAEGSQFKACMDYKNGFEASLGNSVRPYLKKVKKATVLIHGRAFASHTLSPISIH